MDTSGRAVNLGFDIGDQFSLTQPLSLFAVEYLPTLLNVHGEDHSKRSKLKDERYALDVLSVLEAVLDTPGAVVSAQLSKAKTRAVNKMKGEGTEYDARMAVLEEMDYPKPLADEPRPTLNPSSAGTRTWGVRSSSPNPSPGSYTSPDLTSTSTSTTTASTAARVR